MLNTRTPENKRRTKTITKTLNPEWNQTLVYSPVLQSELHTKTLEFTVWDYDRSEDSMCITVRGFVSCFIIYYFIHVLCVFCAWLMSSLSLKCCLNPSRFKPNDFLGEVIIDLNDSPFLDNKARWFKLHKQGGRQPFLTLAQKKF